jgi:hypothetical protein
METVYTGICISKLVNGMIDHIRVRDTAGNELTIPPDEYRRRGVLPPIETLPDCMGGQVSTRHESAVRTNLQP